MHADSVRRLVAAHGPVRGTVFCENATVALQPLRDTFCRAGGPALAEALLGAAGLLDGSGYWTLRPIGAGSAAETAPAVAVHEATATAVRLTLRPGGGPTTLVCHLLVFRDKGDPREVRKRLKDAVEALRAAAPKGPPVTPPVAPRVEPPSEPVAVVTDRPVCKEPVPPPRRPDAGGDLAYLRQVIDAVDAARTAPDLGAFVRAVGLEFGPDTNERALSDRLALMARTGVLVERRNGRRVTGYTVSDEARRRISDSQPVSAGGGTQKPSK